MAAVDISSLSDEKLVHRELELERNLLDLSFRKRTGQLEDTSKLSQARKEIARVRTAERSRELSQGLRKDSLRTQYRGTWRSSLGNDQGTQGVDASVGGASRGFLKGIVDKIKGAE